jgi:hypothetical protein
MKTMGLEPPDGPDEIYYLPGMGGRLDNGLGEVLLRRGFTVYGRETVGAFKKMRFGVQVDAIKQDLVERFWQPEARVIANSFGGYLFLHAQLGLEPFPGRVLLLSPVIGSTARHETGVRFYPPRANVLQQAAQAGNFLKPHNIEVHVGGEDWQAGPQALLDFCHAVGIQTHLIPERGHFLEPDYVRQILVSWLQKKLISWLQESLPARASCGLIRVHQHVTEVLVVRIFI